MQVQPAAIEATWLPVKIVPTVVLADDDDVSDVVSFSRHRYCRLRHHTQDVVLWETLYLGLSDVTF